jgi:predicted nucleic acid-binding Zn finger protein
MAISESNQNIPNINQAEPNTTNSAQKIEKINEIDTLNSICRQAKKEGKLSGKNLTELYDLFGTRFTKALEALKENRVKKYIFKSSNRIVWIVVGRERDYLIMPQAEFCTCDDFYFRVLDKQVHLCYHLIAQKIANNLGWYEVITESDELYDSLMAEWKSPP